MILSLPNMAVMAARSYPGGNHLHRLRERDALAVAERYSDEADAMAESNPTRARYLRAWSDRVAAGRKGVTV